MWKGTLDGYWETVIPEAKTTDGYIIPETRSGYYTIDLTLTIGQEAFSGWIKMRLEQPSRVIHLPGYTAGMSFDPIEFEGAIRGEVMPAENRVELYWVDPPYTSRILWDRYGDYEPSSHTSPESSWPRRLLEGLNPLTFTIIREGELVALSADHITEWEVTPGYYGTNVRRAIGAMSKSWTELIGADGTVTIERNDRRLDLTESVVQAGDVILTGEDSGARIRLPGFDVLVGERTTLEFVETETIIPTSKDIVDVALKEKEEFSWKYKLARPCYLPWITDGRGNEKPIVWGVGRPKSNIFVANVLYKAGFHVPRHHLNDDPSQAETLDPARSIELFDTTRYADVIGVVKVEDEALVYDAIRIGDIIVTPTHLSIVTNLYANSLDVIYYSTSVDDVVQENVQLDQSIVVRRPKVRKDLLDLKGIHSLAISLKEGMIRLFNATFRLVRATLAPWYTTEERQLYTGQVELYTEQKELHTEQRELHTEQRELYTGRDEKSPIQFIEGEYTSAVFAVRGTDLILETKSDGTTIAQLLHGLAKISSKDGSWSKLLFPGEIMIIKPGQAPSKPSKLDWENLERFWEVVPQPTGLISINTAPKGCMVYLDGRYVGESPLAVEDSIGPHSVRIEREGYQSWSTIVNLVETKVTTIEIGLLLTEVEMAESSFVVFTDDKRFEVALCTNSFVARSGLDNSEQIIYFLDSGPEGKIGHQNVTMPKALLPGEYAVAIDEAQVECTVAGNETHPSICFDYTQRPQNIIRIKGRLAIRECLLGALAVLPIAWAVSRRLE